MGGNWGFPKISDKASIPRKLPVTIITKCKACPNCHDNHVEWPTCKLEKIPDGRGYPTWLTNAYTMIPEWCPLEKVI